jgi:hypothetical protein
LVELESVGIDSTVILFNKSNADAYRLGSTFGQLFLDRNPKVSLDFATFLGGKKMAIFDYEFNSLCSILFITKANIASRSGYGCL